jgi:hypothetical protein
MLRANTVIVLLEWLDDAERCYREGIPKSGTEYIGLVRRYLREAAVSDVEVEPIPAPDAPVEV